VELDDSRVGRISRIEPRSTRIAVRVAIGVLIALAVYAAVVALFAWGVAASPGGN
jgi:hypothetical protein